MYSKRMQKKKDGRRKKVMNCYEKLSNDEESYTLYYY